MAQKFWKDEDKVGERIEQCKSQQKVKKGKGVICAVLGACLLCAQKEIKRSPPPEKTADVRYASLKSGNEELKSSLAFEKQRWGNMERKMCRCPLSKNEQLKKLLAATEKREEQLQEKVYKLCV